MNLSAPKQITFWLAVVVAVIGLIVKLVPTLSLSGYGGWLVLIGFVILAAGNLFEGL
jgi:threonine/homoserine/homoserine lactone efflux protein